jgi:hypothetical protein
MPGNVEFLIIFGKSGNFIIMGYAWVRCKACGHDYLRTDNGYFINYLPQVVEKLHTPWKLKLPVFDFSTLIDWVHLAVVSRQFFGYI